MTFVRSALLAAGVLFAPSLALAQAAATCAAVDQSLAPEFSGWTERSALAAGADVTIGKAVNASLLPTPEVKYVTLPEKPGAAGSSGGVFGFSVTAPGAYQVVLGNASWVDVLKDGKAVKTLAFGHGPDCTSIRKFVVFDLTPGRYVLQISGSPAPNVALMVSRKP